MRILVVEDEHRIANTIKKGIEQENTDGSITASNIQLNPFQRMINKEQVPTKSKRSGL